MQTCRFSKSPGGFTLIELMIVVAVVAILAAIAFPSYQEQVRKSRRADAFRTVSEYQLELEKWRASKPTYANCSATCGGTYPAVPTSPYYTIAVTGAGPTAYTVTATPAGGQTGDRCGVLSANRGTSKPTFATSSCN